MIKMDYDKNNENVIITKMIQNNELENILPFKIINDKIVYDIDGKICLGDTLGSRSRPTNIIEIMKKICQNLEKLESYMIDFQNIYLDMDKIYFDQFGNISFMVNATINNKSDIKNLFQNIYLNTIIEIDDNLEKLVNINNYFNSDNYSLYGLQKLLSEEEKTQFNDIKPEEKVKIIKEKNKTKKNLLNFLDLNNIITKKDKKIVKESKL